MRVPAIAAAALVLSAGAAAAAVQFEVAERTFVSPDAPYIEDGFAFTPSEAFATVIEPAPDAIYGGDTGALTFSGSAVISMTSVSGDPFDLASVVLGMDQYFVDSTGSATGLSSDFSIAGLSGGVTLFTRDVVGATAAQIVTLGWSGLDEVLFSVSPSGAIDDIVTQIAPVPLPAAAPLLGIGLLGLAVLRRRGA